MIIDEDLDLRDLSMLPQLSKVESKAPEAFHCNETPHFTAQKSLGLAFCEPSALEEKEEVNPKPFLTQPAFVPNGIPAGFSLPKDLLQPSTLKPPSFNFGALAGLDKKKVKNPATASMNFELIGLDQNNQITAQSDDLSGLYKNISAYTLK